MPLVIASKLIGAGRGLAAALVRRASVVALDWDTRQKSRFEALDSAGRRLAVFLPRGRIVRGGDVLVGEDGSLIRVEALAQPILVVTAPAGGDATSASLALAKAAYHLGNRHVPLEVRADRPRSRAARGDCPGGTRPWRAQAKRCPGQLRPVR